jgi:hypothetical protein
MEMPFGLVNLEFYDIVVDFAGSGVFICPGALSAGGWHAYDERKFALMARNQTCTGSDDFSIGQCPCFNDASRPYTGEFIEKLSLWPDVMNHIDVKHGETLYGSRYVLEKIYENQNPPDCGKAKYLISGGWLFGFGSRIHFEAVLLGMAMHLGRVYLPHPDGDNIYWETNINFCAGQHDRTLTCFYEKFSK